jgi:hypothetical protein
MGEKKRERERESILKSETPFVGMVFHSSKHSTFCRGKFG